ncbi:hypothetical protein TSUD_278450 [Trifolium subterraneum]|uniref:Uncharacterized protein n=1 Tax=Trifolium subterraneum TaxID=3900 RepID=A0A2Z6MRV9_TRISU|nr:hypothetical protein TSUD_278450 [Trifolium subterraneum]
MEPIQSVTCGRCEDEVDDAGEERGSWEGCGEGSVGLRVKWVLGFLHSACFSALGYFAFETVRIAVLNEYVKRKQLNLEDVSNAMCRDEKESTVNITKANVSEFQNK